MGILNMLGLMRVEDHSRIVAKQDAVIDLAASHMKGEDFDGVNDHAGRVALVMARLRAARTRVEKAAIDFVAKADAHMVLSSHAQDLEEQVAALRPDAEKFRAKAKADAERKKAQRAAAKKGAA